jgi:hypothetical protein
VPVILATQEAEFSSPGKVKVRPFSKIPSQKRTGGVAQVVESLPSMYEALNSNSDTTKKDIMGEI